MKQITSKKIKSLQELTMGGEQFLHEIGTANWREAPGVLASFTIGNNAEHIFLRFSVSEMNVKGRYQGFNEPVYKDSCVEFFVSFEKGLYYNFEFSCIGTLLAAYGSGRSDRAYLSEDILGKIDIHPSLGRNKIEVLNRAIDWSLDIAIPIEVFTHSRLKTLSGQQASVNFYKCGDDLPMPHFLSWNPVGTPSPDFHRPEFFGEIIFS